MPFNLLLYSFCNSFTLESNFSLSIETELKNCTDSGKLFNVKSGKCTSQSLASWQCNESAIMDSSFTKIPQKFKDILNIDRPYFIALRKKMNLLNINYSTLLKSKASVGMVRYGNYVNFK